MTRLQTEIAGRRRRTWGGNGDPSNPVLDPNAAVDTYVIELPSYKA